MTAAPTQTDVSGGGTSKQPVAASPGKAPSAPGSGARAVQTLHEAVEAARRFGLMRENY